MINRFFLPLLFLISVSQLEAQSLINYGSVRNTGISYSSISAFGNPFNSWRNTTSFTQDDNRSDFMDIGFDFWYNGIRYTQFCVSTNGFIDFSSSADDGGPTADDFGYSNGAFTSSNINNSTNPAIAPFYDDLTAQGGVDPLGTSIKYYLSGVAPNRTLTVEWINMAVYLNVSPSLNFQVQLLEGTGQVKINYGVMNTGTQIFSYSMGMNSATISAVPTTAQLKELQTVNTNTFNNTVQNNLSAMPAANSQYVFTPPVPATPTGSIAFSAVNQSGMTLNWTNWAVNEVGYVIYNSTDGINFNFVTQTTINATSSAVTGLLPGTTYYWKLCAVSEGCLSSALTGTQATTAPGNKTSIASGNWSSAATWTPNGIPTGGDNVIISNGNTVAIDVNAACNSLTVGTGAAATLRFNGGTARTLTVNNNILINSLGIFNVNTGSNATHSLILNGNMTNNGTVNFATDANSLCDAFFVKNGNQTISGTGGTNNFNLISLSLGNSLNNTLDVTSSNFSAPNSFLTLNRGTFKLSTVNAVTLVPFVPAGTISQYTGLWLNSPTALITTSAGLTLSGKITVSNGTLNVGNNADEDLLSSGGNLNVTGGVLNVAGKYYSTGINNLTFFSISGGTMTVPFVSSTNTTDAPFQITGSGSQYNMTGGLIVIPREGGSGAQDLGFINTGATSGTVTNGTLQIGSATTPANQTISINSKTNIGNLRLNSANARALISTNSLTVVKDVIISSGTLIANNLDISLGGNWNNTGGIFTTGTGKVLFNGNSAQSVFKAGGETFNSLEFSNSGIKTFSAPVITNANFSINAGSSVDVSNSNHQLTVKGNYLNNGSFIARTGLALFNGTVAQTIGGSAITNFNDITLNNTSGASLTGSENLIGTLSLNNGTLNTNGQAFTMVSTATACARIGQIAGSGNIIGNVTVQRFAPGGSTGWALISTPITSPLTFADWNDDFAISCPTCPDGFPGGFYSIYSYNETVAGSYSAGASYVPINNITDAIVPGKGYWVYLGDGQYNTNNITIDVTGTVRKFNYTIPLNYTNYGSAANDGWNLIHNPYPSPVSWTALRGATPNIDNAIYAYNADLNGGTGTHATYINGVSSPAVGSGGIGDVIPMGQGFYVHSTGATGLNGTESIKVSGNPTFLKTNAVPGPSSLIRLFLDGANNFHDESVLYLQPGATSDFDFAYDAYKLVGQDAYVPTIALENNTKQFQVNGVPPVVGNFSMDVKALTGYNGTYTISASNFSSFPSGACINLFDKFSLTTTDLKTSDYIFNLSDTTTVARFVLNITINPLTINSNINQPSCAQPFNGQITASGANAGPWNFYWKDPSGNNIKTSLNKTTMDTLNGITAGTYSLEINTVGQCDNNNSSFPVNLIIKPVSQFSSIDTVYNVMQNGLVNFTNLSANAISQQWNFGDGPGYSSIFSPSYNYSSVGIYTVSLISISGTGCTDTSFKKIVVLNSDVSIKSTSLVNELLIKTLNNNEFLIEQNLQGTKNVAYELRDALGKLILNHEVFATNSIYLPLDLKNYQAGIYYLKLSIDTETKVFKLPVKG